MTKNNCFSPSSDKGHLNGLVDEGKYLRQSVLYKQILLRTLSRLKTSMISVNPVILSISSLCPSCASWLQNPFDQRNPRLINDLRLCDGLYNCRRIITNVVSALQIQLFMQNEPNFRKSQINVTVFITMNYDQMDTWSIRKNEPNTNPNEPKTNPILANKTPIRSQNEPNSNPIYPVVASGEAGTNPIQSQYLDKILWNFRRPVK